MPGPPRTPTETRKARGNPGKRPYNKREPKLPKAEPPMPADLDDDALREWRRLVDVTMKAEVLTEAERSIVEIAAHAYSTFVRAQREINAKGMTYETTNTTGGLVIKARPEIAIASDAWRRYRSAICELGLTPAARAKVSTVDPGEEESPAASYFDGSRH